MVNRAVDLAPAWECLPLGPVDVLVRALDVGGREVAVRGFLRFWRVPGFDGVVREPLDWAACVDRTVDYLLAPPRDEREPYEGTDPRSAWTAFEDSVTGMRGRVVYPALHHATFVMFLLAYAARSIHDLAGLHIDRTTHDGSGMHIQANKTTISNQLGPPRSTVG